MRCLLDTHALLWAVVHPDRLSIPARRALDTPSNTIIVSVVSFWEISVKFALKRLDLEGVHPEDFPQWAQRGGFLTLPLDADTAATHHQLPLVGAHKDPFDRMLVWQAIRGGLTLVSRDGIMAAYAPHGLTVLW